MRQVDPPELISQNWQSYCDSQTWDELTLRNWYKTLYKAGLFDDAVYCGQLLLKKRPIWGQVLYAISRAAYHGGNYDLALDYGERLRIRNPAHAGNLILLAYIYTSRGEIDRGIRYYKDVLHLDPQNRHLSKLNNLMEKQALAKPLIPGKTLDKASIDI